MGEKRRYVRKDEASLPMVQLESLMMNMLIDAHEKRDVATANIVRAYLIADMNDFTVLKINSTTVDIICKVNPSYTDYVSNEWDKKTLYLRLTKALYGYMQLAFLWYQTFKGYLERLGFKINL